MSTKSLFYDHCQNLLSRYKIDETRLVEQDVVAEIRHGLMEDILKDIDNSPLIDKSIDKIFKVTT